MPNGNGSAVAAPIVPFVAAAHEHTELMFDESVTPGASDVQLGPFDVPAYGYLRHILLEVTGAGGDADGGSAHADFPFNILRSVSLQDVNGGNICGPLDGFALLQANVVGGYSGRSDPRNLSDYDDTFATPSFMLRIPVEVSHRDGFGSLANQHSAASYKVNLTIAALSQLLSGGQGSEVAPTIRIRGWLEAWSLPDETDLVGRRQADIPPMMGTTMHHSFFTKDVQVGDNTVLLPRVGNLIRHVTIISRDSSGDRDDSVFADPVTLEWDARQMRKESQGVTRARFEEALPPDAVRDTGVHAFLLNTSHKNMVGDDSPQLWYPTVQSTRLQLNGNVGTAGTWQIITCDIAPVEVVPSERFVLENRTGHQPAGGAGAAQAGTRG